MMPGIPNPHAIAALVVTIAMFIGFARGRLSVEIVSLLTIAVIAVGLYFFPLPGTGPTEGLRARLRRLRALRADHHLRADDHGARVWW
jgi:hypothetical protein